MYINFLTFAPTGCVQALHFFPRIPFTEVPFSLARRFGERSMFRKKREKKNYSRRKTSRTYREMREIGIYRASSLSGERSAPSLWRIPRSIFVSRWTLRACRLETNLLLRLGGLGTNDWLRYWLGRNAAFDRRGGARGTLPDGNLPCNAPFSGLADTDGCCSCCCCCCCCGGHVSYISSREITNKQRKYIVRACSRKRHIPSTRGRAVYAPRHLE